jgi:hypothetical protein
MITALIPQAAPDVRRYLPDVIEHWTAISARWRADAYKRHIRPGYAADATLRGTQTSRSNHLAYENLQTGLFDDGGPSVQCIDLRQVWLDTNDLMP